MKINNISFVDQEEIFELINFLKEKLGKECVLIDNYLYAISMFEVDEEIYLEGKLLNSGFFSHLKQNVPTFQVQSNNFSTVQDKLERLVKVKMRFSKNYNYIYFNR